MENKIHVSEYSKELERIKQIIESNYTLLENYNNANIDKKIVIDTIRIQRKITADLFLEFEDSAVGTDVQNSGFNKLNRLIDSNYELLNGYYEANANTVLIVDTLINQKQLVSKLFESIVINNEIVKGENHLTIEWWNGLSDVWKDILIMHIEFENKAEKLGLEVDVYHGNYYNPDDYDPDDYQFDDGFGFSIIKVGNTTTEFGGSLRNYFDLFDSEDEEDIGYEKPKDIQVSVLLDKLCKLDFLILSEIETRLLDDLSPLARLTALTFLYIKKNSHDLQPISSLVNLKELVLIGNKVDLQPLSNLIKLETLDLSGCYFAVPFSGLIYIGNKQSLSPVSVLSNLKSLYLVGNEQDLGPLEKLENLEILDLNGYHVKSHYYLDQYNEQDYDYFRQAYKYIGNKNNLMPLAKLKKLKSLRLDYNNMVLTPLSKLPSLSYLSLVSNSQDLTPILNLKKLELLVVVDSQKLEQITGLIGLREIHMSVFNKNMVSILSLPNLKEIFLVDWAEIPKEFDSMAESTNIEFTHSSYVGLDYQMQISSDRDSYDYVMDNEEVNINHVDWWNELSEDWKEIFLWNIGFWEIINKDDFQSRIYRNGFQYFNKNVSTLQTMCTNNRCFELIEILIKIFELKCFYLDKESNSRVSSLKPLEQLKTLKSLYIPYNRHDLTPICTLALNKIDLSFNIASLIPFASRIDDEHLGEIDLSHNKASLDPIEDLYYLNNLYLSIEDNDLEKLVKFKLYGIIKFSREYRDN